MNAFKADATIYNREELSGTDGESDEELLQGLLRNEGLEALREVQGCYAFAWDRGEEVVLGRDLLGRRPLFYAVEDGVSFASRRRVLERKGLEPREVHPRNFVIYDRESGEVEMDYRGFLGPSEGETGNLEEASDKLTDAFLEAVDRRVDGPTALLFSGGVDSTMIAAALRELGKDFTCYTAGIQHGNVDPPEDVEWAEEVAEDMGLDLEIRKGSLDEVEEKVPELVDLLSSSSVVKAGVALPEIFALEDAEEDVVLSGLGSEQLFAGYSRQREDELDFELVSGLRNLFHRDLYRDNVSAAEAGMELRLPFLDQGMIEEARRIPGELKVRDGYRKYVLREAAENLGVPGKVAWRGKKAAQYGSNFDKALSRLAKDRGVSKQEYLKGFRDRPDLRLAALFSGGKDSNAALYRMSRRNNEIGCLLNLRSRNPDSYMFDSKERTVVKQQSSSLGIPLLTEETPGEKEEELEELERMMERAREECGAEGVVSGALASVYQRKRVEEAADRTGLKAFSPLWMEDQEGYMRWLVREGFEVKVTEVKARGLDEEWEGRTLDRDAVEELVELSEEHGFQPAGEGGGFETVVVDGPMFSRRIDGN
ncbi:MAG: diphthine--ammonia ligase [Candidatus Nanohaloarchaea archaeon]|nr:diphthine--ammonia ligase [Candidatus Nanohaloarchaea archaeon]